MAQEAQICGICYACIDAENLRGRINSCTHVFCSFCIVEWGRRTNVCPLCKSRFTRIETLKVQGGEEVVAITEKVRKKNFRGYDISDDESGNDRDTMSSTPLSCRVCQGSDSVATFVLCDRRACNYTIHLRCLPTVDCSISANSSVPLSQWVCPECKERESANSVPISEAEAFGSFANIQDPEPVFLSNQILTQSDCPWPAPAPAASPLAPWEINLEQKISQQRSDGLAELNRRANNRADMQQKKRNRGRGEALPELLSNSPNWIEDKVHLPRTRSRTNLVDSKFASTESATPAHSQSSMRPIRSLGPNSPDPMLVASQLQAVPARDQKVISSILDVPQASKGSSINFSAIHTKAKSEALISYRRDAEIQANNYAMNAGSLVDGDASLRHIQAVRAYRLRCLEEAEKRADEYADLHVAAVKAERDAVLQRQAHRRQIQQAAVLQKLSQLFAVSQNSQVGRNTSHLHTLTDQKPGVNTKVVSQRVLVQWDDDE